MSLPPELSERPSVILEIPNFGYGPASAALALAAPVADRYTWHIASSGGAAAFAARQLPGAVVHEFDTNQLGTWDRFAQMFPPESVVVTFVNPEFAAWAVQRGYRVGLVDTLDWMWGTLPETVPQALAGTEFHMIQEYFAMPGRRLRGQCDIVRPLVDRALWCDGNAQVRPRSAMIGFGGMQLPYGNDLVAEYVRWFLGAAVPTLVEQAGVTDVSIVGGRDDLPGLIPAPWAGHPAVSVHVGLDRRAYAALARGSEHVLISPGLAHVYECALAGLAPLIQPGFGMSMVLQAYHVALAGYEHMYTWPWLPDAVPALAEMSEPDGMRYANEQMMASIKADPTGQDVAKAVSLYLARGPEQALRLPVNPALPDGAQVFAGHLARLNGN
ncbi:MAG TPA: hypothetical protein VH637_09635 [Streptosporangiaceae bacterium]|jgi:hypothetical protein